MQSSRDYRTLSLLENIGSPRNDPLYYGNWWNVGPETRSLGFYAEHESLIYIRLARFSFWNGLTQQFVSAPWQKLEHVQGCSCSCKSLHPTVCFRHVCRNRTVRSGSVGGTTGKCMSLPQLSQVGLGPLWSWPLRIGVIRLTIAKRHVPPFSVRQNNGTLPRKNV